MSDIALHTVLSTVTDFYLNSRDFNGISGAGLAGAFDVEWGALHQILVDLINEDLIGILYADVCLNTHIIRTGFEARERQIEKLETEDLHQTSVYPRPKHLQRVVDRRQYDGQPYKLCLALGEPQLACRSFDLSVLEFYRNDPRYLYSNDDISGSISVHNQFFESNQMAEHDQILLESFGFSYDAELNRAVAVFLRYLARLSAEHQQIWKAKELSGDYGLHPDYFTMAVVGEWRERESIFTAFGKEVHLINMMAEAMGRPPLFRCDFGEDGENTPAKFSFLVRPTLEEFNSFVHMLDKMLSDNINRDFFRGEVPYESEIERSKGRIEVQNKATLRILDEWVREFFHTDDWEAWDKSIKTLRHIRTMRQRPAHALDENVFAQEYFKEQRELIIEAYSAVRTLRMMLENHPAIRSAGIQVPEWLREGRIWTR